MVFFLVNDTVIIYDCYYMHQIDIFQTQFFKAYET